jgi:hypothetical protein
MDVNIVEIPPDELVEGNQYLFMWSPPLDDVQMNIRSGIFTGYIIDPFEGFSFENIRIINRNYPDLVIPNENYSANIGPRTLHFFRYIVDVRIDEIISNSPFVPAAGGKKRKSRSLKRRKSRRRLRLKHAKSSRK